MKRILLILTLIILVSIKHSEASDVRIGILTGKESVNVSATGYMDIIDLSTNKIVLTTYGWSGFIRANHNKLEVKDIGAFRGPLLFKPIVGAKVLINGNRYRGEVEVVANGNTLKVINIINIEEYLYGVIKNEMPNTAPMEALKAQAVIARTFVLANLKKHEKEGYDLCSGIHCQVYRGMDTETDNVINAVNATQGEILTYNGNIANTVYHAWCGGITSNSNAVWKKDIIYLREVVDPFCGSLENEKWHYTISLNEIKNILNNNGFNIGNIEDISAIYYDPSRDKSGRVDKIVIKHSNGVSTIDGNRFRTILGWERVWSTLFTIIRNGDKITFQGIGKGHGVGLCQRGAMAMGRLGYNYKEILGFYYPGVYLRTVIWEKE